MKTSTLLFTICLALANVVQSQTNLLKGPEGIAYHPESKSYFVSNATDGKIIRIDSLLNQSVHYEGLSVPMGVEILGDSLFVSSNDPSTVSCIDVYSGDLMDNVVIPGSMSMAHMDVDPRTGHLYVIGQQGRVYKINSQSLSYSTFVGSGLPNGTQTCSVDTSNNCLYIFSWPVTKVRRVNLADPSDIQLLVYPGVGQQIDCTKDHEGNIYVSSWQGNKILQYLPGCTAVPQVLETGFNQPAGLYYNPDKHLIAVCNYGGNSIDFIELETTSTPQLNYNDNPDFKIFPNPFNSACTIEYYITDLINVKIEILDLQGRLVQTLQDQVHSKGKYTVSLEGYTLQEGIYCCKFSYGAQVTSKKLLYMQ